MTLPSKIYTNNQIYPHEFGLLESNHGQIFLHVSQIGGYGSEKYGPLYVLDTANNKFSLSTLNAMRNVVQCELEKIVGLNGVILLKIYDPPQGMENKIRDKDNVELLPYKRTIITFDNGQTWQSITPPKVNSNALCEERENCSLHLHLNTYGAIVKIYNSEDSLGLIIGVGNVGKYHSSNLSDLNTYLSRDGGHTWHEVFFLFSDLHLNYCYALLDIKRMSCLRSR